MGLFPQVKQEAIYCFMQLSLWQEGIVGIQGSNDLQPTIISAQVRNC